VRYKTRPMGAALTVLILSYFLLCCFRKRLQFSNLVSKHRTLDSHSHLSIHYNLCIPRDSKWTQHVIPLYVYGHQSIPIHQSVSLHTSLPFLRWLKSEPERTLALFFSVRAQHQYNICFFSSPRDLCISHQHLNNDSISVPFGVPRRSRKGFQENVPK